MKKPIVFCLAMVFLALSISLHARNYYFSSNGNDNHNGITQSTPWQSLEKIRECTLKPGDSVLFKCGDVFTGSVLIKTSGTEKRPIVFTSYGTGPRPVIKGSVSLNGWIQSSAGIFEIQPDTLVRGLYLGNSRMTPARFPNRGFLFMGNSLKDAVGFIDQGLSQPDGYWNGATVRYRGNWQAGNAVVVEFSGGKVRVSDNALQEFNFRCGYYFDNKPELLDTCNEWFFNASSRILSFMPDDPSLLNSVNAVIHDNGFTLEKNVSYITFSNLRIEKYDAYGISCKGGNGFICIENNSVSDINGTAIHFDELSKGALIKDNQINRCTGRGIYAFEPDGFTISDNRIKSIGFNYGYGITGVHGMVGIAVVNREVDKAPGDIIARNNTICRNFLDSIGYVGIRCDGTQSRVEENVVRNTMLCLNDGGAIYCWATGPNYSFDNVIRNNIVYNCQGNVVGAEPGPDGNMARGIYLDNYVYNIMVEGNTVANVSHAGIYINDGSHDNQVRNNTVFNTSVGICVNVYSKPGETYNHRIENNIVCGIMPTQRAVGLIDWTKPNTDGLARFVNNSYINLREKFLFQNDFEIENKTIKIRQVFQFQQWQSIKGHDLTGVLICDGSNPEKYSGVKLLTNETLGQKSITLGNESCFLPDGSRLDSEVVIAPLGSTILLLKN
jgi:parallel beta-helix repeat protein